MDSRKREALRSRRRAGSNGAAPATPETDVNGRAADTAANSTGDAAEAERAAGTVEETGTGDSIIPGDEGAARLLNDSTAASTEELAALERESRAAESGITGNDPLDRLSEGGGGGQRPAPVLKTGEALAKLYVPLASVLAPNWKLTADECKALGEAHGAVIDFYFPDGLAALGPWGSAILVTAAVVGPRMVSRTPPRLPAPKPAPPAAPGERVVELRPGASAPEGPRAAPVPSEPPP